MWNNQKEPKKYQEGSLIINPYPNPKVNETWLASCFSSKFLKTWCRRAVIIFLFSKCCTYNRENHHYQWWKQHEFLHYIEVRYTHTTTHGEQLPHKWKEKVKKNTYKCEVSSDHSRQFLAENIPVKEEMETTAANWSICLQSDLENFSSPRIQLTQFLRKLTTVVSGVQVHSFFL